MLIRSFLSLAVAACAFTVASAQQPEARPDGAPAARAFAFSFDGQGGYLGVQTREVTSENYASYGLRGVRGVAVEKVMENSPAAAAGLQAGDVILRVGGEEVTSTRKLSRLISEIAPDHQVKLTFVRNGREQNVTATLGKRPGPGLENGSFRVTTPEGLRQLDLEKFKDLPALKEMLPHGTFPEIYTTPYGEGRGQAFRLMGGRQIGVSVYPVTKQLGERFGVESGVMINSVRADSPAAKAGLSAGDIIVEVDGKAVRNQVDLVRALNEKKEGDLSVTYVRDRSRQTVTLTPEAGRGGTFFYHNEDGNVPAPPAPMGGMPMVHPRVPAAPAPPVRVFRSI